jgi:MFS family permease
MTGPERGARRFVPALLRERTFRSFWFGQTISMFGDQVTGLALPVVAVLALGAEATQMGLHVAIGLLPHLLFSLPAGVWLDRVRDRRRLMIFMDLGRAAAIASIPVAYWLHWLSLPLLFAIFFLVGTLSVVFDLAWNTLFVAIAKREQFIDANSLLNGSRSLCSVGGPALGGVLIQVFSAPLALVADALSFVGSAFFLRRIRVAEAPIEHDQGSIRSQLATGLSFLIRDPIIRPSVLSVATMNLFNYCFQGLFVLYVLRYLLVEPGVLGVALGVGAVGSVLGALVSARVGRRIGIGPAWVVGLIVFPAATILVPVAGPDLPMAAILALLFVAEFVSGFGVMILDVNGSAMLFARTPDRIRGRANGAFRFVNMGVRPIGAVVGGVLGGMFGVRETLLVVTIAQLLGVLWLIGSPIPRLRDLPEVAQEGPARSERG